VRPSLSETLKRARLIFRDSLIYTEKGGRFAARDQQAEKYLMPPNAADHHPTNGSHHDALKEESPQKQQAEHKGEHIYDYFD
jgi:hypothetical protein